MSPAQVPPAEGLKSLIGADCVEQPELLAAMLPYPPMPLRAKVVVVVAGMAIVVVVAGDGDGLGDGDGVIAPCSRRGTHTHRRSRGTGRV